jgi:regulator of nonsense transcripts 2
MLIKLEKANDEYAISRGEILDERVESFQQKIKAFEKLKQSAIVLSTNLNLNMPNLEREAVIESSKSLITGMQNAKEDVSNSIWEDEESKMFYQDIVDLQNLVPGVLLGQKTVKNDSADEEQFQKELLEGKEGIPPEPVEENDPEDAAEVLTSSTIDALISRLPNSQSRESIDKFAVDFAFLNKKANRKKLSTALLGVSRHRLEVLPYYSRLIATLDPFMPDISSTVIAELISSFRYHQRKKERSMLEDKVKIVRFIAELTKFGVVKRHVIFFYLKTLLENFSFHNIDLVCTLLENCGKFLYRNPETTAGLVNFVKWINVA